MQYTVTPSAHMSAAMPLKDSISATLWGKELTIAALWRHEVIGAFCFTQLVTAIREEMRNSEISDLSFAINIKQNVLRFEIPMHYAICMHYSD